MSQASQSHVACVLAAGSCAVTLLVCVGIPLIFLDDRKQRIAYFVVSASVSLALFMTAYYIAVIRPVKRLEHTLARCLDLVMEYCRVISAPGSSTLSLPLPTSAHIDRCELQGPCNSGQQQQQQQEQQHQNTDALIVLNTHHGSSTTTQLLRLSEEAHVSSRHGAFHGIQGRCKDLLLALVVLLREVHK